MGELVILPRENVRKIDASGPDMIKFVISGGVGQVWEEPPNFSYVYAL